MKIKIILLFILIPFISFCQKSVTILDSESYEKIIDVQILSDDGALLFNTDINGTFTLSKTDDAIKKVVIYHPSYDIKEYDINEIPNKILLEKSKFIELDEVVVEGKRKKQKYFKVRGYARSWQLVNDKLVKYSDALIDYLIPFKKGDNDVSTGIKRYIISYRIFKIDTIKDKSKIISITFNNDSFFKTRIPIRNILQRQRYENYSLSKVNDTLSSVFKDEKKVGYVVYKNENPIKIGIEDSFSKEKNSLGLKSRTKDVEIWSDKETKHLLYSYSNERVNINNKLVVKTVETVNEFFIDENISYDIKRPKKSKEFIRENKSYYESDYWSKEFKKHPLPINIETQLLKISEKENTFRK